MALALRANRVRQDPDSSFNTEYTNASRDYGGRVGDTEIYSVDTSVRSSDLNDTRPRFLNYLARQDIPRPLIPRDAIN